MAEKSMKEKYLEILEEAAYDPNQYLSKKTIDDLMNDLDTLDATKVPQWLVLNKRALEMIPEIASKPEFISVTENPKVVEKDYGFTEKEDFYKMDGPKSWLNKSPVYLEQNAKKYGLDLPTYLDKVRELSTAKELERQWEDNANVKKFEKVPVLGDVSIPSYTRLMLPTAFNKAARGDSVTTGDVVFDIGTDAAEAGMATSPVKFINPFTAALAGNAARQAKTIADDPYAKFSLGELAGAGTVGALGLPVVTKSAGDVLKKVANLGQSTKPIRKLSNWVESLGDEAPASIAKRKASELEDRLSRTRAVDAVEDAETKNLANQIENSLKDRNLPVQNPSVFQKLKDKSYGTDSKFWRRSRNGEFMTPEEAQQAEAWLREYERGGSVKPSDRTQNPIARAKRVKNLPEGEVLINAWSESPVTRALRRYGEAGSSLAGGRIGSELDEAEKKAVANQIVNSTEWQKYIAGLPNSLTDYQIYLGTVYGEE